MTRSRVLSEFWQMIKYNKKYWLVPIIVVLALIGSFLVIAGGSALAPFIYTLF